nr:hypothetical protein GCM10020093_019160 [Planobispora longispora]
MWQYRQRSGHPAVKTTKRVPGPSTPVEMSQEWTEPVTAPLSGPASERAVEGAVDDIELLLLVRRTKLTAYPETRMVSWGYLSGLSIASSRMSRLRTLTFMWKPPPSK